MDLDETLQLHALRAKAGFDNMRAINRLIDASPEGTPGLKQMSAKVSTWVHDELHEVCTRLDMSKREFIEKAVVDAIGRAHEVIKRTGLDEAYDEAQPKGAD